MHTASFLPQLFGALAALLSLFPAAAALAAPPADPAAAEAAGAAAQDATDALQRWLLDPAAHENPFRGGQPLRISRTLEIDLDQSGPFAWRAGGADGRGLARIVMTGPGPAIRLTGTHGGTAAPNTVQPQVWQRQATPTIVGLEIVGEHPEACGIELRGTMQPILSQITIRDCLHGIHLTGRNRNVLISDCHLYSNRGIGVYLDDVNLHQINITGCHISYNAQGGVVSRRGNVRNLHITGCDIESNMSPDTDPTANVLIDSRGSTAGTAEVAITGCTIQHNSPGPDSANIRIIGNSDPSPRLKSVREGNITITGNVLSDVQVNVHLVECRGVTLNGNTFWMGYQHNLLAENCSHLSIGPNNFDRNPRYAYGDSLEAKNAIVLRDCHDCTLSGLHVSNVWKAEAGIVLQRCQWMNINHCTILDCDGPALLLEDCRHCLISGLMIRDARRDAHEVIAIAAKRSSELRLIDNGLIHGQLQGIDTP